jgi:hypothetical protein
MSKRVKAAIGGAVVGAGLLIGPLAGSALAAEHTAHASTGSVAPALTDKCIHIGLITICFLV